MGGMEIESGAQERGLSDGGDVMIWIMESPGKGLCSTLPGDGARGDSKQTADR